MEGNRADNWILRTERRVRGKAQEGDAVTRAGRSLRYLPARTRIQCPLLRGEHNSQVQAAPISPQDPRPRVGGLSTQLALVQGLSTYGRGLYYMEVLAFCIPLHKRAEHKTEKGILAKPGHWT